MWGSEFRVLKCLQYHASYVTDCPCQFGVILDSNVILVLCEDACKYTQNKIHVLLSVLESHMHEGSSLLSRQIIIMMFNL